MSAERDTPDAVGIETATPDDRLDVLRVLDAAMLETDSETVDAAIDAGDALVARFSRTGAVVGALVATRPDPGRIHVDAVAVRRARRGRGIGSALVAAVVRRAERDAAVETVTAAFDADLRAFYADLGFAIRSAEDADESRPADAVGNSGADRAAGRSSERLWGRVTVAEQTPP
ncbi:MULTISPECIES: GNAT family N-acetyltransferase [Halorubrum]|uniref:GNAT family N-acetyltransferase n=1 Tax=Halorubrum persicum TaxID=1383844 RepID=A0A2G1WHH9_9EURY|nr:GNAT family N-acetyltransferase [Halorubrum persicum]PHQ38299.1 GNAT family N-acetyltransferase [Halorubrum persicum]